MSPGPFTCTLSDMGSLPGTIYVRPKTTGPWFNTPRAAEQMRSDFPPTAPASPTVFLLDLNGVYPVASVLHEYVVTLAREIRDGMRGPVSLVVDTKNLSIRQELGYLAGFNQVPLYLASQASPLDVAAAEPGGVDAKRIGGAGCR